MTKRTPFDPGWTKAEKRLLDSLDTPLKIQAFIDRTTYSDDPCYRSPRRVMKEMRAHCVDGALMACAALRHHGHPPLVVDMLAENDDDHFLAVVRIDDHYGAIAKSNFVGIRFREPIFRTVRELVLSYFEDYYNTDGYKSLRAHSAAIDLSRYDDLDWSTCDDRIEELTLRVGRLRHTPILTRKMIDALAPVDERRMRAGLYGVNPKGLYVPGKKKA